MPKLAFGIITLLVIFIIFSGCTSESQKNSIPEAVTSAEDFRTVTDSRGVNVTIPADISIVATVSDGLVEEVMYILGEDNKIAGIGSKGLMPGSESEYSYPKNDGTVVTITGGKNVAVSLSPGISSLPLFVDYNTVMNYEILAAINPDLVIMRLGSSAYLSGTDENAQKCIERIESLGIPVVVLYSPNCFENSDPTAISDEIKIICEVFGKKDKSEDIISAIESRKEFIRNITINIPDEEKKNVLVLGLSSDFRTETAAGIAWGLKTTESYMIEKIVNAKNAFRSDTGGFSVISTEHILSLNPDVIILGTASGYHPPGELHSASYYKNLRELTAVKQNNIASLSYAPRNAAERLEYPINLMIIAKSTYPELFEDISLNEWILDFYRDTYGVDNKTAEKLRSAQILDWCKEI